MTPGSVDATLGSVDATPGSVSSEHVSNESLSDTGSVKKLNEVLKTNKKNSYTVAHLTSPRPTPPILITVSKFCVFGLSAG